MSTTTKKEILKFRNFPKESLENIVLRMKRNYEQDLVLTDEEHASIEQGLKDTKKGRIYTTEQLNKELGLL